MTVNDEKIVVQVSDTRDSKLLMNKVRKLNKYENFRKICFFNIESRKEDDFEIINLQEVINDLENDIKLKGLIKELS